MADRDAWGQPLYRFALVLVPEAELARKITFDTLEAMIARPPLHVDEDRLAMLLFQGVRRRALKDHPGPFPAPPPGRTSPPAAEDVVLPAAPPAVIAALHALPEPGRSALALLLLDALEADNIAKLLGLAEAELALALHGARVALHRALAAAIRPAGKSEGPAA